MPFKSVINEYYARDISKKVRSAKRTRALNGEHHAGKAPYGYIKSQQDKRKLVVDHEAAAVVKLIFQMCADGQSTYAICKHLFEQRVPTPSALEFQRTGKLGKSFDHERPWDWRSRSVDTILRNQAYLGHMVNGRQTTKSFKNHDIVRLPQEEWIIVPNTHEALVDEDIFEKAQRALSVRERPNKHIGKNMFAGLLKCADCGKNLNYHSGKEMRGGEGGFNCDGYRHSYRSVGERCTAHNTPHKALREAVLAEMNEVFASAAFDPEDFLRHVDRGQEDTGAADRKAIGKLKQRDQQLRVLTRRVFEQNAGGMISDETFAELYNGYQNEQKTIAAQVAALEAKLAGQREKQDSAGRFHALVGSYRHVDTLTREILLDLVEKIIIHEGTGIRASRHQVIKIHWRFVGELAEGEVSL